MLEKTMNKVLKRKFNEWVETIDNPEVKKLVEDNTIITGGAIASLMQNEKPNDYDIYFRTKEVCYKVAQYYANKFNTNEKKSTVNIISNDNIIDLSDMDEKEKRMFEEEYEKAGDNRIRFFIQSSGVVGNLEDQKDENYYEDKHPDMKFEEDLFDNEEGMDKDKEPYFPVFFSSNAVSLRNKIQVVIRFYGDPDQIHETYDYVHTKGYWTSWDRKVIIPKEVYEAIINKTLLYTGSLYPICSLFRMRKFINRGFSINAGQILKISYQISELDLTDINVLEDQLIGVDSLYFSNLIRQLAEKKKNNPEWEITQSYVISIIDKIF